LKIFHVHTKHLTFSLKKTDLNWYCVKCTCFRISYVVSPNASNAVRSSYTARHMQSYFAIFRFMARGLRPLS